VTKKISTLCFVKKKEVVRDVPSLTTSLSKREISSFIQQILSDNKYDGFFVQFEFKFNQQTVSLEL
jgi:peroxiredoxin